jgi:hypothetical protein
MVSSAVMKLASREYKKLLYNPSFYGPKEEPFKRYTYEKQNGMDGMLPYKTEWPSRPNWKVRKDMAKEYLNFFILGKAMKTKQIMSKGRSKPNIDNYLINMVSDQAFGFGL